MSLSSPGMLLGRYRAARAHAVRIAVMGPLERGMLPPINTIHADVNAPPVASMDEFVRRSPLILVASGMTPAQE